MKMTQIAELVNGFMTESLGGENLITDDLSNVISVGKAIAAADMTGPYYKSIVNKIGKTIFVERVYKGRMPSVMRDGWDFGSILEKIRFVLPEANENMSWGLVNGQSYDQDIYTEPEVHAKYFNDKVTFEIPVSRTDRQISASFESPAKLQAFWSAVEVQINNAMTKDAENLIKRTVNNMIAETVNADFPGGTYTGATGVKAINLLYEYNQTVTTPLTVTEAITNKDFLRFAVVRMATVKDQMAELTTLYNIGGTEKFTPEDRLHVVYLSQFARGVQGYMQSDAFHKDFVMLPTADVVTYWQGPGEKFAFDDCSTINVKTSENNTVEITGVVGVMFDHEALGVCCENRRVTTHRNDRSEFTNYWYKMDAEYLNDFDENCVVFYLA